MYDDGPDALRLKRLERLRQSGIVKEGIVPHEVVDFGMKEWDEMDAEERGQTCRTMEVYAGMVQ